MKEAIEYWWVYTLTPRTRADVICFTLVTILAIVLGFAVIKMKLPIWKFQIAWICINEALAVLLLISRLSGAQ